MIVVLFVYRIHSTLQILKMLRFVIVDIWQFKTFYGKYRKVGYMYNNWS